MESSYLGLCPMETGNLLIIQGNHKWLGLEENLEIGGQGKPL